MLFELKVAFRFLKEGKSQTILILSGVAIGVAVQIFLSSLISGLQESLVNQTVGNSPHIIVKQEQLEVSTNISGDNAIINTDKSNTSSKDKKLTNWQPLYRGLEKQQNIIAVAPFYDGSAFAFKGLKSLPVQIRGTYLDKSSTIYNIKDRISTGNAQIGGNDILIGTLLAKELGLKVGDILRLSIPEAEPELFIVSGVFDLENSQLNERWVIMDIVRAQKLFNSSGDITSIELKIKDVFKAESIAKSFSKLYKEASFESWQENNRQLLSALQSQSSSSNVIQFFVFMAVTMGISSVLAVSVMQKSKQIGILKAMGATSLVSGKIFLIQGAIVGLSGSIIGSGLGAGLIKSFLYFTSKGGARLFPIDIKPDTLLFSIVIATIAGTGASLLPAINSARLNPIEVIKGG